MRNLGCLVADMLPGNKTRLKRHSNLNTYNYFQSRTYMYCIHTTKLRITIQYTYMLSNFFASKLHFNCIGKLGYENKRFIVGDSGENGV